MPAIAVPCLAHAAPASPKPRPAQDVEHGGRSAPPRPRRHLRRRRSWRTRQWGVVVRSLSTGERAVRAQRRQADDAGVEHEDRDAGGGRRALGWDSRFTTTLETAAPVEGGVAARRPVRPRRRRSDDQHAQRPRRRGVRRVGRGAEGGRHHAASTAASSATTTCSTTRASARGGRGTTSRTDYAAPVGALQYNEDVAALTVTPGARAGRLRRRHARRRAAA